ncbi:MAG TPA: hypothetical protein VFG11_04240 [Acidobacteriota bacterium]|nr:hypothetical protein [Acidobacteriota bacterium]
MDSGRVRLPLVVLALFLTSFCYLAGITHPFSRRIYTGIRSLNASDYNQDLSWIDQCRKGHLALKNLYTSEPQNGFLIRPVTFAISIPFGRTHLSNGVVFHVQRLICGALLLFALFPLLSIYDPSQKIVNIAFALIVFTSGMGALVAGIISSADLSIPESSLFLSLGEAPHFAFSFLLLWFGLACYYKAAETDQAKYFVLYMVSLALLWFEHPFDAVTSTAVVVANLWHLRETKWRCVFALGVVAVSIPFLLYYQALRNLPQFAGLASAQNLMRTPAPLSMLSAFLPLLVFAILGCIRLKKVPERSRILWFLVVWIGAQIALIYSPVPFQRRMMAGIQFPLALLAAYALDSWRPAIAVCVIALCSITNLYVMVGQTRDLSSGQMPYYLPKSYAKAFDWLAAQDQKGAVLSEFITGNFIPGQTGFPVYMGHSSLTPEVVRRRKNASAFFRSPDPDFLKANHVQYIFWGSEERHTSSQPMQTVFKPVYDDEGIAILAAP